MSSQLEFVRQDSPTPIAPRLRLGPSGTNLSFYVEGLTSNTGQLIVSGSHFDGLNDSRTTLFGFAVGGLGKDFRYGSASNPLAPVPGGQAGGVFQPQPSTAPPVIGRRPLPVGNALTGLDSCRPVRGSVAKRLRAAIDCTAAQQVLQAKCGYSVASAFVPALRSSRTAKNAKGLYILERVNPRFRPVARVLNDLSLVKYKRSAPKGFRTPAETRNSLTKARTALDLIETLPKLRMALKERDYQRIVLHLSEISQLDSCIRAAVNAVR